MRIGMILDSTRGFPPDIRVEKESKTLSAAGHRVLILASQGPKEAPVIEFLQPIGATVIRTRIPRRHANILGSMIHGLTLYDSRWLVPISRFVREHDIQVLHVHDSLLVPTALKVGRRFHIPVVADLHENMPAAMIAFRSQFAFLRRLVRALRWNYHLMRFNEASALRKCIRTIVVVPEAAERIYSYGISKQHIVVVSNTEDETTFNCGNSSIDPEIERQFRSYWIASYIGGIGPHRGIDTTLESLRTVHAEIKNFLLLIIGATDKDRVWISKEVAKLGIEQAVLVMGWQPFSVINNYILISAVCLVPHNDFEHTQTTIPHKLFQYMICGKPVLVSNCRPLARVVSQSNCGRIFKANSSDNLAEELIWMYHHPEALIEMGRKGREAALGKFSWKIDASRLTQMYKQLDVDISLLA